MSLDLMNLQVPLRRDCLVTALKPVLCRQYKSESLVAELSKLTERALVRAFAENLDECGYGSRLNLYGQTLFGLPVLLPDERDPTFEPDRPIIYIVRRPDWERVARLYLVEDPSQEDLDQFWSEHRGDQ